MLHTKVMKKAKLAVWAAVVALSVFGGASKAKAAESGETAVSYQLNTEQAGTLVQQEGRRYYENQDWYKFTTGSSEAFYELTLKNISSSGVASASVYSDVDGTEKVGGTWNASSKGTQDLNLVKLEKNTTYYIEIEGNADVSYKFTLTETKDDVKDTPEEATQIKVGKEVKKTLQNSKDVDWFSFTTDSSDSFYEFSGSNLETEGNVHFEVYSDSDATECIVNTYAGAKKTVTENLAKIEKNHTYYVKVDNYKASYKFKLTKTKDDVKDTAEKATTLTLNETGKYKMENTKDVDYFKFKTTKYKNYTLTFSNLGTEDGCIVVAVYSGKDCLDNENILTRYIYSKDSLDGSDRKLTLSANKTYYIKVYSLSNAVGSYKIGVSGTAPSSLKISSASSKITVTWNKVSGASGYEIYRATKKKGTYTKVATVSKAATVSYTDSKDVKKGSTYYYKVRAYVKVSGKTYYSDYTSVESVKAK